MRRASTLCVALLALLALLGAAPRDSDGDGMPDRWERRHGLNPDRPDPGRDPDRDKLDNILEFQLHGHPLDRDTDGDGLRDGAEVLVWHTRLDVKDQAVGHVFALGTCPTADPSCPPRSLFGIPVALRDAQGLEIAATTTHTNGRFSFQAPPGTYRVEPRVPSYFQAPGPPPVVTISRKQSRPARADLSFTTTLGPGVVGQATQSPTCPVQRIGDECVSPLEGATIRIDDSGGRRVTSMVTGPDGHYGFSLDPGSYTLVAEPIKGGAFPIPPGPVSFTVKEGDAGPSWIASDYDTGIRR